MHPGPFPPQRQPWEAQPPPPPAARGGTTRILAFGCLGLVLLTALGTAAAVFVFGTLYLNTGVTPRRVALDVRD